MCSGVIGCLVRRSIRKKIPSRTMAAAKEPTVQASLQPSWAARMNPRQQGEQDADRHVDEQHPAPRQPRGEHAAGEQADGRAGPGHRGEHAERPVALGPFLEVGGDQRERRR
jgi:hypothetical protein